MKAFVGAAVVAAASAAELSGEFDEFVKQFGRNYASAEEKEYRKQVFHKNLDWIAAENAKGKSYRVGVTQFADLTFDEFKAEYLTGYLHAPKNASLGVFHAPADFVADDSVDWTTKGAVTPIKDQAHCGSCWSFSTTGALEGAWKIAGHDLVSLSEQNILDCDKGGDKCKGGSMEQAFDWVKTNGICSETADPYKCQDQTSATCTGSTCDASSGTCSKVLAAGDVTGSTEVGQTEGALEAAVTKQPVSVAIEADKAVFQHYTGGVLKDEACGETLDHGVLVVGYGTDAGQDYWKVKNSWGTSHGEEGYWRIERGSAQAGGECGIRKGAVYPSVKSAGIVV
jgi:C1A family cysteine protease